MDCNNNNNNKSAKLLRETKNTFARKILQYSVYYRIII